MFARLFDSPVHLLILVLIIVVVFGWKRLPDAARSLGRSARILKSEVDGMTKSDASGQTVPGEQAPPTAQQPTVTSEALQRALDIMRERVDALPAAGLTIVATGPLTAPALAA